MLLRLCRNSKEFLDFLLEEIGDFISLDYTSIDHGHCKTHSSDNSLDAEQSLAGETAPVLKFD
jgi:hypothetical protein